MVASGAEWIDPPETTSVTVNRAVRIVIIEEDTVIQVADWIV